MKWRSNKSALKRWIEAHRSKGWRTGTRQVVLAILPRKIGYDEGAPVHWLEPVQRVRESRSWKSSGFFDPGYSSWWHYTDAHGKSLWKEWWGTRPIHHLAGLVNLTVYWSLLWGAVVAEIWFFMWVTGN